MKLTFMYCIFLLAYFPQNSPDLPSYPEWIFSAKAKQQDSASMWTEVHTWTKYGVIRNG